VHIILIGYRGTGKSAIGKRLAEKLGMPFYDTDEIIEAAVGRSIREMVAQEGWECFRDRERGTVRELQGLQRSVIATGGGAVMDKGNAEILKRCGVLIWLDADVKTIVERIQGDMSSGERRPSFSCDDIVRETENMLEVRIPVYRGLADFSVNTGESGVDAAVAAICRFLKETGQVDGEDMTCQEVR